MNALIYIEEIVKHDTPRGDRDYVIWWPETGLNIPWPEGKTAKEAVEFFMGIDEPTSPDNDKGKIVVKPAIYEGKSDATEQPGTEQPG